MSEQKDLERAAFEDFIIPSWSLEKRTDSDGDTVYVEDWVQGAWIGWQKARSLPVGVPDGYMPIPTAEQLADALENVRCYHDMSAELIAPELLANLLAVTTVKAEQVLVTHDLRAKLISGLDEIGALSRNLRQGGCDSSDLPGLEEGLAHAIGMAHELISLLEAPYLPAAGLADLTAVRCQCCATEYPHDSYDAGFIAGSGMCQVCDAAMPPKDLPAAGSAELIADAERCLFVMREIGSMDGDDITGDDVDLRFEDDEGRDTGCDVSIVEYAEKSADVIEKMIAALSSHAAGSADFPPPDFALDGGSHPCYYAETVQRIVAALSAQTAPQGLRIVLDGPPGPEAGRFVEVENAAGRSVNAGEWRERADGLWELVLHAAQGGE